ncbi:hypothetical protein V8E51_010392 [Hyaloscypha variabilis]
MLDHNQVLVSAESLNATKIPEYAKWICIPHLRCWKDVQTRGRTDEIYLERSSEKDRGFYTIVPSSITDLAEGRVSRFEDIFRELRKVNQRKLARKPTISFKCGSKGRNNELIGCVNKENSSGSGNASFPVTTWSSLFKDRRFSGSDSSSTPAAVH